MICLAPYGRAGLSTARAGLGDVSHRRCVRAARPSRRPSPRPVCSLGGLDSGSLSSGDGEDPFSSSALNRELERRTGKLSKLAEHLDLLLSASEASSSSVQKCECCRGTGEQECNWCHGTGAMTVGDVLYCSEGGCAPCPVCRGTGQCKCPNCCGTGKRASWLAKGPQ